MLQAPDTLGHGPAVVVRQVSSSSAPVPVSESSNILSAAIHLSEDLAAPADHLYRQPSTASDPSGSYTAPDSAPFTRPLSLPPLGPEDAEPCFSPPFVSPVLLPLADLFPDTAPSTGRLSSEEDQQSPARPDSTTASGTPAVVATPVPASENGPGAADDAARRRALSSCRFSSFA